MRTTRRQACTTLIFGALALGVLSSACATPEERSTWERVSRTGIVRVGYAVEVPFALVDSTGHVSGESPEVLRLVMKNLGVDSIEWVATEFRSLILELQRGEFDVIAAGMYITPERERSVLFTRPTLRDPTALLVRSADVEVGGSLEAFATDRQARLAIIAGSAEEQLALAAGLAPDQLLNVPDPTTARVAVQSQNADAFMLSMISLAHLRRTRADSADLAVVPLAFPNDTALQEMAQGRPAYAVRLDDTDFRDALNGALNEVLGTPAHQIVKQQFGIENLPEATVTGTLRQPPPSR